MIFVSGLWYTRENFMGGTYKFSRLLLDFFYRQPARKYKKAEIVIRLDEEPQHVYFIEKGFIRVYSITPQGNEKLHIIYKAGEMFPLIWTFNKVAKSVYYEALGEATVRRAKRTEFLSLVEENHEAALDVIQAITHLFNIFADRVENLESVRASARLAGRLLSLAHRFGVRREGGSVLIDVPITHTDIANSIALTRETTSREIERLRQKGILADEKHILCILSLEKLENELLEQTDE